MQVSFTSGELVKNELAADALRRFGALRLRVVGSSMLPAVVPKDELIVRRSPIGHARLGDLGVFLRGSRLFAHRVVEVSGDFVVTQGDSISTPDEAVQPEEWLGTVDKIVRASRVLEHRRELGLKGRIAAAVFRRSAIARRAFSRIHALRARP